MALDEALLLSFLQGASAPTLRFYQWDVPHLSLGAFQSVTKELDVDRLKESKIPWLRRPTGGGAVFHEGDLTFSLIAPSPTEAAQGGVRDFFRKASQAVKVSLVKLGIQAEIADSWKGAHANGGWRGACFASVAPFEISVNGKKLVGQAQWVKGRAFLQQSTLLLRNHQAKLVPFLKISEGTRLELSSQLDNGAVGLEDLFNPSFSSDNIKTAIKESFLEVMGAPLEEGKVSRQEESLALKLVHEKYGMPEWALRL